MIHKSLSRCFKLNSLRINPVFTNTLSSSSLSHSVTSRSRHDWGSWDNRIDFNILLQQSINYGRPIPKISSDMAGSASVIGRRTANEDRIRIKELRPDLIYLAVFDGHGGSLAADFCSHQMELFINYWLQRGETDLEAILQNAFIEVNNALARHISLKVKDKDSMYSGTTATVCLLKNSVELTIANVGDSRTLLCRNGDARRLTIDHNPSLKSEKERIVKSGGTIIANSHGIGLVNGRLAMTRSIGDLDLKPYGVIALPYTRSLEIKHGKDSFLVMTTDGISFVMSDQEIVDAASRCGSPSEAANFIVEQALHYACDDNASTIVIPFGAWGKTLHNRNIHYSSFGRELCRSNRY